MYNSVPGKTTFTSGGKTCTMDNNVGDMIVCAFVYVLYVLYIHAGYVHAYICS